MYWCIILILNPFTLIGMETKCVNSCFFLLESTMTWILPQADKTLGRVGPVTVMGPSVP